MMNPIKFFHFVMQDRNRSLSKEYLPSVKQLLWMYVVPLAIIPPLMIYLVLHDYPKLFMDILPGNRLLVTGIEMFVFQVVAVLVLSWITQNLAAMVNLTPSFRDCLLVIAVAATPLWLLSFCYLVPNMELNLLVHGLGVLLSGFLVYRGIINVFGLKRRGAIAILTMSILGTAGLGFAVILVGTLISWSEIQKLQLSIKG
jgi:hypothetical protein